MNPTMQQSTPMQRPATLFSITCHHVVKTQRLKGSLKENWANVQTEGDMITTCYSCRLHACDSCTSKRNQSQHYRYATKQEVEAIRSNGSRFHSARLIAQQLALRREDSALRLMSHLHQPPSSSVFVPPKVKWLLNPKIHGISW